MMLSENSEASKYLITVYSLFMTKEDIENMRAFDPELVSRLENGEVIKSPKYVDIFHMYQQLDTDSKLKLIDLIDKDLNNS